MEHTCLSFPPLPCSPIRTGSYWDGDDSNGDHRNDSSRDLSTLLPGDRSGWYLLNQASTLGSYTEMLLDPSF